MNARTDASMRRGACPGLSVPMATGDGLLARLTPAGSIMLDAFNGLCMAAQRHGNGIIEITSRGSIQIRGLNVVSAPLFAAEAASLAIEGSDGVPVITDPLSGLGSDEAFDVRAIAAELRKALALSPFAIRLEAKVSVVIDGGAALSLDALATDIRLRAINGLDGSNLHVALGGDGATATPLGAVSPGRAVECVLRLFESLAATAPRTRMRDALQGVGLNAFKSAVADLLIDVPVPPARPAAVPIGIHQLSDGRSAVGIGFPFGHSDSGLLTRLIDTARQSGATGVRTAPGRALLVLGLSPATAPKFVSEAGALGFVVDPADLRRRVVACAGAPFCASGEIPARAVAPAIADAARSLSRDEVIHVSGCAKGCAHPAPAPVAVFGRDGQCDVFVDGALSCSVVADVLPGRIAQLIQARGGPR